PIRYRQVPSTPRGAVGTWKRQTAFAGLRWSRKAECRVAGPENLAAQHRRHPWTRPLVPTVARRSVCSVVAAFPPAARGLLLGDMDIFHLVLFCATSRVGRRFNVVFQ